MNISLIGHWPLDHSYMDLSFVWWTNPCHLLIEGWTALISTIGLLAFSISHWTLYPFPAILQKRRGQNPKFLKQSWTQNVFWDWSVSLALTQCQKRIVKFPADKSLTLVKGLFCHAGIKNSPTHFGKLDFCVEVTRLMKHSVLKYDYPSDSLNLLDILSQVKTG